LLCNDVVQLILRSKPGLHPGGPGNNIGLRVVGAAAVRFSGCARVQTGRLIGVIFNPDLFKEISMETPVCTSSRWSTAALGAHAGLSSPELSALVEHLQLCRGSAGRLFGLHCLLDTLNGFVAARFVTTLVTLALLIGVSAQVR
jgi:hypothetical protein